MKKAQMVASICPYCGCGCGFYICVEEGTAKNIEYMPEHPVCQGALCPKGNAALDIIYHPERLRHPLKKENGNWVQIGWNEAFDLIAGRLNQISQADGADALGFLTSAKCTNEENYLLQKLARSIGTNNIDHCARL